MNAHQIIAELYTCKEVDHSLRSWFDPSIVDDVKQDLFEILLVADPDNIVAMYQRKQLRYWVVRIIINLSKQERNVVFRNYRTKFLKREVNTDFSDMRVVEALDAADDDNMEELNRLDSEEVRKLEAFGKLSYYHQELIKLWVELGSQRKVYELTNIKICSIKHAIKKARQEIQQHLNDNNSL